MSKLKLCAAIVSAALLLALNVSAQETADAAVMKVFAGLDANQPQVLWHALPASYQADVAELVHGFANHADEQLWNGTFRLLGKAVRVLDEKRDFILQQPMVAEKMNETPAAEGSYGAVVKLLDTIVSSELADVNKMRTLNVEMFLAGTAGNVLSQIRDLAPLAPDAAGEIDELAAAKATLVSQDGDRARVRLITAEKTEEEDFVRVEGKWIPAELAKDWDQKVEEARTQLSQVPGADQKEETAQFLMALTMFEHGLDQMLAAQTNEEFGAVVQQMFGMVMMQAGGALMEGKKP